MHVTRANMRRPPPPVWSSVAVCLLCLLYINGATGDVTFAFTKSVYNASLIENSPGKTYVQPSDPHMGIDVGPSETSLVGDVTFSIVEGDPNRLFKPESRRIGDFCFLGLRTKSGALASINREQTDSYRLVVVATSKVRGGGGGGSSAAAALSVTARAEVLVTVIDANDLSPLFDLSEYHVDVPEGVPLHQSVARLTASDADIGVNGEIYYGFTPSSVDVGAFSIHPITGVVTVTRRLVASERSSYELEVFAKDRGPIGERGIARFSRARLIIAVVAENRHAPEIVINELPSVVEHGAVGTVYAILTIRDNDFGRSGLLDTVRISSGDPDGYFKIQQSDVDGSEYVVEVVKMLDRETNFGGFSLTVEAVDRGRPPLTGTTSINVRLQDINDNSPIFASSSYRVSVDECLPVGTPVLRLSVGDDDSGENGRVTFSIGDTGRGLFTIGSTSGVLAIASGLDYETLKMLNITVVASDHANPASRRSESANVEVDIVDCNDNAPIFSPIPTLYIDENKPAASAVYKVEATDADSQDNGFVGFTVVNTEGMPFAIDPFNGQISTKRILDFESMPQQYSLLLRASDWGSPYRRESEVIVRIRVRDANDNRPQFERVNCTVQLSRDAPSGTELVVASAIDFDKSSVVTYRILSGNDDDCLELDHATGQLRTKACADGLNSETRTVVITASDGVNDAEPMSVNISLISSGRNRRPSSIDVSSSCRETHVAEELVRLDRLRQSLEQSGADITVAPAELEPNRFSRNLHQPRFSSSAVRRLSIPEGSRSGEVAKFVAVDEDPGYNGRLMFVISSGNDRDVFQMDTYNGTLNVVGVLDRETQDQYLLNITVVDMGIPPQYASMLVDVTVEDVNDNAPVFERAHYVVGVQENVPLDTAVATVIAHDKDLGANGRVTYRLVSHQDVFSIDSTTGQIRVAAGLDRETVSSYELSVAAVDSSSEETLSGLTTVTVRVEDVNDNPPIFIPESYHLRVLEDLPVGTVVATLYARDPDLGSSGTVRYTMLDGADGYFEVERMTGVLRLSKELSFSSKQVFNLTMQAKDRGQERTMSSRCQVLIDVVPINRNLHAPLFRDYVYQGRIRENQPPGTSVMQLVATDKDSLTASGGGSNPNDYQIKYSIRNGTGLGRFSIDSKGMIYTKELLDRETHPFYWLTVYAQDSGLIPLSSFTEVYIEVDDVNDNAPQTSDPVYYPTVPEQSPEGTPVFRLEAFDHDSTANGALTYEITSGNPQGFFVINRTTGQIATTRRILDREKQDEHILEVTVSDNGQPSLSSSTRVIVTVTDDNDEAPVFLDRQHRVRVPRLPLSRLEELGVYRVVAYDRDIGPNGDVDYSLGGGDRDRGERGERGGRGTNARFRINQKTGMLYALRELEKDAQYDLSVKAADNGRPQQRSAARVTLNVVDVPTSSPNAPVFTSTTSAATMPDAGTLVRLMESDEIGSLVSIVSATDADNDKLWYYIVDGNVDSTFSIDVENGNINLARRLDWEAYRDYNLTVMVTDGVHETLTVVYVVVLDINDNTPVFDQAVYYVEVPENTAVGTRLVVLRATDHDDDRQLFYTIYSASSSASLTKFKIDSETGVITTLEELNRESMSRHELTVMVRDGGTRQPKRGFARVVIEVLDHNDHSPEFVTAEYEGQVYSTAAPGTSVLQVQALDRDKGVNAELTYSIVSGNIGTAFTIDKTLGLITVSSGANLNQPVYRLVVRAADAGSPSLSSTASVTITTTALNTVSPIFEAEDLFIEVPENLPEGAFLSVIHASCRSSVTYSLVDNGESSRYFAIDPSSGVLMAGPLSLDYETVQLHNVTVRATNFVGAFSTASIAVHVSDVNDNRPKFNKRSYVGTVVEGSPVGSVVFETVDAGSRRGPLMVRATDVDYGLNAMLKYRIVGLRASDIFDIEAETGAIRTKVVLDRELTSVYQFGVQVTDMGVPPRSADYEANVTIYVEDINDSPPVFTEEIYSAKLFTPTHAGVVVARVNAIDPDLHSSVEFAIDTALSSPANLPFHINPRNGFLMVSADLNDVELQDSYTVSVTAFDGKFLSRALVQVAVEALQSTGLRFSESEYQAEVSENSTGIEQVALLQVTGHQLNEHLTFRLLNADKHFTIHSTSGVVRTTGIPFDRELSDSFTTVAEVRDGRTPPRVAHTIVRVTVLDINDNTPMFVHQPYFALVPVDSAVGDVIRQVKAVDRDAGNNSIVDYSIVAGNGVFSINSSTGEIIVNDSLSKLELNVQYRLVIEATDRGEIPLSSQAEVFVSIVNQAMPVFEESFYNFSVAENVQPFSAIATVTARSPMGNPLVYSIVSGDDYGEFGVDYNIGALTLIDQLDYETNKNYRLTVRAADIISKSYADTVVHVQVEDVNDNDPVFDRPNYAMELSENAPIGTPVLTVLATDADEGSNARLHYHIKSHPSSVSDVNYFYVDSDRGIILVKQRIDRERAESLRFVAVVSDSGIPVLSTSAVVTVNVVDVNDNAPVFDQVAYEASISDKAKRGQFVVAIGASDIDASDRGRLTYAIVSGNVRQAFSINATTGVIVVSNAANRRPTDLTSNYVLNVSVTDGIYTSFAPVRVTIDGSNAHAPVFSHAAYEVDVAENQPAGSRVSTVTANDADRGTNGEILYHFAGEDADELFAIDSHTGTITTRVPLDREAKEFHEIRIIATDGGGRTGYTAVRVRVTDHADHVPSFTASDYKANVYATAHIGTSVMQLSASDEDVGLNRDVEYSIVSDDTGTASSTQFFNIDSRTGLITTSTALVSVEKETFQFFVRAKNTVDPQRHSDVPVEIYVMGATDRPPAFSEALYRFNILEDSPPATTVAMVTAYSNGSVTYALLSDPSNGPSSFAVNNNGVVTTVGTLDRELKETHELTLRAETLASPSLVAHARFIVHVNDVNDNAPQFETEQYHAVVAENGNAGVQVIQVVARDRDASTNAEFSYRIGNVSDPSITSLFSLNSNTGWITIMSSVDREAQPEFHFQVVAVDQGTPPLSSSTVVNIIIGDENDNGPVFAQQSYSGAVNEDALPGTIILTILATDADMPPNNNVVYHIASGDPLRQFGVRRSGEIHVSKALDREEQSQYELTVIATDGAFVATAVVTVSILDANDNAPICDQAVYSASVTENVAVGSFVVRVSAVDNDEPGTRNSRIEYSLDAADTEMFAVHQKFGVITTKKLLDRESLPEHEITVIATDGGGLSCRSIVHVILADVNDNPPVFTSRGYYTASVAEDAVIDTPIVRVSASDPDLGINRRVRYAIVTNATDVARSVFRVDPLSGVVTLLQNLDREDQAVYNLNISATDQGSPHLTSFASVVVMVLDINDNPPEFEKTVYSLQVIESAPVGSSVGHVFATSRDIGINAKITYSIISSIGSDFTIDPDTGFLMVSNQLDYEQTKEYVITVQASDGGSPSLSSTAVVKIDIADANDNRPVFVQAEYQAVVREDVSVNTSLLQVEAADSDAGLNGHVEYHIAGGDLYRHFSINRTHGHVFVAAALDRESISSYELIIIATDGGLPALTSTARVKIQLLDVNDSPPQFSNNNFTATIQADASLGTPVFTLMVVDADLDPNGQPFTYDVVAGNQNEFYVDRSGVVRTATRFNRQIKDSYQLTIRVYDNGSPPLYSEVSINVLIIEDKASPPVITPLVVSITVAGDLYSGGVIGQVIATDRDPGDQLLYGIVNEDDRELFDIGLSDGIMRAVQSIDNGSYIVNVSVTDGRFIRYTDVRINIEEITSDAKDNAVVVRINDLTPEEFVEHHLRGFISALRSELTVRETSVKILSIQPSAPLTASSVRRRRSDDESSVEQIDVLVAVQKADSNKFIRGNSLKRRIESSVRIIEQQAGIYIVRIFNNVCTRDSCDLAMGMDCVTIVSIHDDTPISIISGGESFVSVKHQLAQKCICRPGSPCNSPAPNKDPCTPGLCTEPKICRGDGQSYMCVCPDGRGGENCEDVVEAPCNDLTCRRDKPMTFSGNSFVRWRLTVPMERRLSLNLRLRTVQKRARVMHAVGRVDYSILEIEDGMIQYRFDCGSGPAVIRVDKIAIDDGHWHSISVERISKTVRVIIDEVYVGEGNGPGPNDVLNLDSNDVFFGAEVETMAHGAYDDVRNGFVGCMQYIRIDLVDLPLFGGSSVAVLQGMQDIEFHCRGIYIPGVCSSSPCRNGATCLPQSANSFVCKCRNRFVGLHCEIDTNPCASNPCLNGGVCENLSQDYRCTCPGKMKGIRCELAPFCEPNPCHLGAKCTESPGGPICDCPKGYEGELCDLDIDECRSNPCSDSASCQNFDGGYLCNCSNGLPCVDGNQTNMRSSAIGISLEEAIGIGIVVFSLIIIALVVVFVIRYRRRRQRKHRQLPTAATDPSFFGTCEVDNDIGSISCDKTNAQPLLPLNSGSCRQSPRSTKAKRPSSCSFETGNKCATTKFESPLPRTMDYGSAADDLENAGQSNGGPPFRAFGPASGDMAAKSPTVSHKNMLPSPVATNQLREPSPKVLNNLNKAEFHRNKHPDKMQKMMPAAAASPSMQSLQLLQNGADGMSASDLQMSESEDDLQGYHWDMSDWNPAAMPLLQANGEVRISPTSSHHSTDYNVDIDPDGYDATDIEQFDPADDSEYVGDDSEFTENECEDDGFAGYDEPNVDFPQTAATSSLDFQQILAMRDELNYGTEDRNKAKRRRKQGGPKRSASSAGYGVHPNMYLPTYNISVSGSVVANDDGGSEPDGLNGNFTSADYISRDGDDDVIHYGFPASASLLRPRKSDRRLVGQSSARDSMDDAALDNMSINGCRSVNDSELDLARVCEIEDSEANNSDDDDDRPAAMLAKSKHLRSTDKSQSNI